MYSLKYLFIIIFSLSLCIITPALANQSSSATGKYLGGKNTLYPSWFKDSFLDFKDDIDEATKNQKRVMIIFHQDGCPYCNALIERNFSQKDILEKLQQDFDIIAINIWGDREIASFNGKNYTEKDFSKALKVQFTPTIIIFNEQAKIALRRNGYLPPKDFKLAIDYASPKQQQPISFSQFLKQHQDHQPNGQLNTQAFFQTTYDLAHLSTLSKPFAVFFEQTSCPNCDKLHQKVLTDPDTREVIQKFNNIQLDIWSDQPIITPDGKKTTAKEWAQSLNVDYAPSILLFDKTGKEIIRSEAFFKTFHTQSLFHYVLEEAFKTQPNLQRYLSARAEHIREQGVDVNIWK